MGDIIIKRPTEKFTDLAKQIHDFSVPDMEAGNILSKSAKDIEFSFLEHSGFVAYWVEDENDETQEEKPVGFISYRVWNPEIVEIMTLIVSPAYRNNQIAKSLALTASEFIRLEFPDHKVIYMLRQEHIKILDNLGFKRIFMLSLPQELLRESCQNCSEKDQYPQCSCKSMALIKEGRNFIYVIKADKDPKDAERMAKLYCQIWKEPPWDEFFHSTEKTLTALDIQLKLKNAICLISKDGDQVNGFTWGYTITQKKLREVCGHGKLDNLFEHGKKCFYISELGVSSQIRSSGIGTHLTETINLYAKSRGADTLVLRTDEKAEAAIGVYERCGFKPLPDVHDTDNETRIYWVKSL